ncbi:MAG: hypothetical protein ACRD2I_26415, partial [Vicinamibacterales bacterium]
MIVKTERVQQQAGAVVVEVQRIEGAKSQVSKQLLPLGLSYALSNMSLCNTSSRPTPNWKKTAENAEIAEKIPS